MKANQTFRENDEAVSPVIGVILMVAITVVLAAVVFVLVTKLSGNQTSNTPSISFDVSDTARTAKVINTGGQQLKWGDATNPGIIAACSVDTALPNISTKDISGTAVTPGTTLVSAGDIIAGCDAASTLTVRDTVSNTLVYSHTFP